MILARDKQAERARALRRMYPIHFYGGRNGSGKTLAGIYDSIPSLEAGRPILSTVRILDYHNPRPCDDDECTYVLHGMEGHRAAHPLYKPFDAWQQLIEWRDGDVFMDEITGVADSNEGYSMPSAVRNILPQLRRRDVALRITGLNWIRADKRIREATNAFTHCRSSMPVSRKLADGTDRLWRPRRLAKWVTYDAQTLPMDDFGPSALGKADKLASSRFWIPGSLASSVYDTLDPVLSVGSVTDSGRCVDCSGTRRVPECSCASYVQDRERRKVDRAQAAPAASTDRPRLRVSGGAARHLGVGQ